MLTARDLRALPAVSDRGRDERISFTYDRCPRCRQRHALLFRRFERPIESCSTQVFTHWAACPSTHEPVMITYLLGSVLGEDQDMR